MCRERMKVMTAFNPKAPPLIPPCRVPLPQSVGRVSAELLCPYPPGVPLLMPGEVVSQQVVELLQEVLRCGGVVTGGGDSTLQTLGVVAAPTAASGPHTT